VIATSERVVTTLVHLHTKGSDVDTTPEHPFFVPGRGFVRAGDLKPGDAITTRDASSATTLLTTETKTVAPTSVFNMRVENSPTYYVGKEGLLVHNGGDCVKKVRLTNGRLTRLATVTPGEKHQAKDLFPMKVRGVRDDELVPELPPGQSAIVFDDLNPAINAQQLQYFVDSNTFVNSYTSEVLKPKVIYVSQLLAAKTFDPALSMAGINYVMMDQHGSNYITADRYLKLAQAMQLQGFAPEPNHSGMFLADCHSEKNLGPEIMAEFFFTDVLSGVGTMWGHTPTDHGRPAPYGFLRDAAVKALEAEQEQRIRSGQPQISKGEWDEFVNQKKTYFTPEKGWAGTIPRQSFASPASERAAGARVIAARVTQIEGLRSRLQQLQAQKASPSSIRKASDQLEIAEAVAYGMASRDRTELDAELRRNARVTALQGHPGDTFDEMRRRKEAIDQDYRAWMAAQARASANDSPNANYPPANMG
ncbi:hypothetical protein EON77_09685, partial [bacterium]